MSKANRILPVAFFGILLSFLVLFGLRVQDIHPLETVTPAPEESAVTWNGLWSGGWQTDYSVALQEDFFGHNDLVRFYNQYKYSILHELPGNWIIGEDEYMFYGLQTESYVCGSRAAMGTEADFDAYAKEVRAFQDALAVRGKSFVYMLEPAKCIVYEELLPWNYRLIANQYADDADSNYAMMITAFQNNGVQYYDMTSDLLALKDADEHVVFANTGHHFTPYAASVGLNQMFTELAPEMPDLDFPTIEINSLTNEVFKIDTDIKIASNLWFTRAGTVPETTTFTYSHTSENSVYLFGSSYGAEVRYCLYSAPGVAAFNNFLFQQYFTSTTNCSVTDGATASLFTSSSTPEDMHMAENILRADLVMVDQQPSEGILLTHQNFFAYMNEYFANEYYEEGEDLIMMESSLPSVSFTSFYEAEPWGRWMNGTESSINVNLMPTDVERMNRGELTLTGRSVQGTLVMDVYVNNHFVNEVSFTDTMTTISLPMNGEWVAEDNTISFVVREGACSPFVAGLSEDARYLGAGMGAVVITGGED